MTCVRLFRHRRPPPTRAFPLRMRFACRSYDLHNLRWAGELPVPLYREPLAATRKDIPGNSILEWLLPARREKRYLAGDHAPASRRVDVDVYHAHLATKLLILKGATR